MADFIAGLCFDVKYFSECHLIFISFQSRICGIVTVKMLT